MEYKKIYGQIIERAKNRPLEGYKEKHHITPRCMGGSDDKENIVELTSREHFLCNMLLCEIYPKNKKLWYALFLMSINRNKKDYNRYIISSKTYERIKTEWNSKIKGVKKPVGFGDKIRSEEKNKKIGLANKKPKPEGFGEKLGNINRGKKRSKEFIDKHIKRLSLPILQYDKKGNFIKEWESATQASLHLNINKNTISSNARGVKANKSAGGFIWKLKNNNNEEKN
jgi:hypothetical protein